MTKEQLEKANVLYDDKMFHSDYAAHLMKVKENSADMSNPKSYGFVSINGHRYPQKFGVKVLDMLIDYHVNCSNDSAKEFEEL